MNNYNNALLILFPVLTETCPNPTTEVADVGLRLDLASIRMLALSLNILCDILHEKHNVSMISLGNRWFLGTQLSSHL